MNNISYIIAPSEALLTTRYVSFILLIYKSMLPKYFKMYTFWLLCAPSISQDFFGCNALEASVNELK